MTDQKSDFNPSDIIRSTNRHDKDIGFLKKKIGDNEAFAKTFAEAAKESVTLEHAVNQLIDKHDNHKVKIGCLAVGKAILMAGVGAVITWLVTQGLIIPQYRLEIDSLKDQIEQLQSRS